MDLFAAVHRGFEERLASQRLSARFGRWRSAHEALVVFGEVETLVDSAIARGLDADGVIDQALPALSNAAADLPSDVEAKIVDRHVDAETNLLPPNAEDNKQPSNARERSGSQSGSQSISQSGSQLDRLSFDYGNKQVGRVAGTPMGSATRVHARPKGPRIERSDILVSASCSPNEMTQSAWTSATHCVPTMNQLSDLHFNTHRRVATRT